MHAPGLLLGTGNPGRRVLSLCCYAKIRACTDVACVLCVRNPGLMSQSLLSMLNGCCDIIKAYFDMACVLCVECPCLMSQSLLMMLNGCCAISRLALTWQLFCFLQAPLSDVTTSTDYAQRLLCYDYSLL